MAGYDVLLTLPAGQSAAVGRGPIFSRDYGRSRTQSGRLGRLTTGPKADTRLTFDMRWVVQAKPSEGLLDPSATELRLATQ
jgi:hypothetical protein